LPDKPNLWSIAITAIASLLIGFALSTLAYRVRLLRVPGGDFVERLDRRVHLTPAQREQVSDVLHDTRFKIEGFRRDFERARRGAMWDSYDKVHALLTPEQQKIFDRDFSTPWGTRGESESGPSAAAPSASAAAP
jgi:hypothetical protein